MTFVPEPFADIDEQWTARADHIDAGELEAMEEAERRGEQETEGPRFQVGSADE